MSGWSCPHEKDKLCTKVDGRLCDPGMKGCVLAGKYTFATPEKTSIPGPRMTTKSSSQSES
ncbi:MAG: hypothetical protein OQK35_02930 [Alphaproteobacteria bacterium]|nr:hypothetical protein [Rhodospirillales bacterium]MCW9045264.1 hypothetical protein [Alphaproteobacteria bacterium]